MEAPPSPPASTELPPSVAEKSSPAADPTPSLASTEPPTVAAAVDPQPAQPLPPTSSIPSTTATPPPSLSSSAPTAVAPIPPFQNPQQPQSQEQHQIQPQRSLPPTQQQQRLPPRNRPQAPPQSQSSSSPSPIQRGGIAIGVPALHSPHSRPQVPAPFSSFRPSPPFTQSSFPTSNAPSPSFTGSNVHSPSFNQPISGLPRSSTGMIDQSPNSNTQVRQPVTGVQTIGMIGSLSTAATAAQIRASGVPGQQQQRLGQPSMRSLSPLTNQNLSSQKFQSHGVSRTPSMASPSSQSIPPQSSQSLQQPWMSTQGKQTHPVFSPSSSYRPQMKQPILPQRSQAPQQQQHQLQLSTSQQQQNKHHQMQHQQVSVPQQLHEQHPPLRNQQSLPQQQQATRVHGSTIQKSNAAQPGVVQSGATTSVVITDAAEYCDEILSKRSIQELVSQIDPSEKLAPEIEDVLVEVADDFIESITTAACSLAKHRDSTTLEAKDILLHVERNWNMTLPGFGGDEIKLYKRPFTNDVHKERLAMVKKSMVGTSDAGSAKNPSTAGQAAASSKSHSAKAPAMTIGSPPKAREST